MEELLGGFLVIEGGLSMFLSQDQRVISNLGRGARILVGLWLIRKGAHYKAVAAGLRYDNIENRKKRQIAKRGKR